LVGSVVNLILIRLDFNVCTNSEYTHSIYECNRQHLPMSDIASVTDSSALYHGTLSQSVDEQMQDV